MIVAIFNHALTRIYIVIAKQTPHVFLKAIDLHYLLYQSQRIFTYFY